MNNEMPLEIVVLCRFFWANSKVARQIDPRATLETSNLFRISDFEVSTTSPQYIAPASSRPR